ncbi:MAG: hypothetical protein EXR75_00835, partial [Myxococcales bacterium]|nr:hypothetical protein [Myxococcales bacterium]
MNKSGAERGAIKPASEDESRKKSRGDVGEFDSGTTSDDDSRKKLRGDVGEFDSGTSTVDLAGSVAKHFARRVLMRQVLVAIAAYALVLLLAPFMLMLDAQPLGELWLHAGAAGLAGTMFAAISSRAALRSGRAVLEALAFYPDRVDAGAFGALAELPYVLTLRLCAGAVVAASLTLVPALRPSRMDDARASSLALLFLIIVGAASVLCYVAVRDATLRALEIGPSGQIASWLEHEAVRLAPRRRTVRKVVLAIMAPVALVGGGALLVTHAHLRTLVEESRATTAARVARIALGGSDLRFDREAREEALAAALAHGFS